MVKKDLNSDLKHKGVEEKYYFFLQLWHELLDQRTLDIYQYRLFNTYSALNELVSVIDKTICGVFTNSCNIEACTEECAYIVKQDNIIKKYNSSLWNTLNNHLNKKHTQRNEQLSLKFQVSYAISQIEDDYLKWIFDEIQNDVDQNDNINIIYHSQVLISQCIFNGWSTKSLYQCDRFFYNTYNVEIECQRWEQFKKYLYSSDRDFDIFINIKDISPEQASALSTHLNVQLYTGGTIAQNNEDYPDDLKHLFLHSKKYVKFPIKAKDIFSAAHLAIKTFSDKINVLSFYNIINAWDMKSLIIVAVDSSKRYFKSLTCEDLFKTYDYIDVSGYVYNHTVKILKEDRFVDIKDKLIGAFSYSNISHASLFHEEKYMTLWIALESLSRTEMCTDIISNVKNTVPAALSIRYLFRIIRNFAEDLIRCNIDLNFSSISYDINKDSKSQLVKEVISIMKDDELYSELESKCICSNLLFYRVKEIKKIICDLDYAVKKYTNYYNHVLWQIQRLYRIRNEIAHSATAEKLTLTIYTEHLYDYLSTFVAEIVSCVNEKNLTTIGEVFCKIQDNYNVFKEIADNREKTKEDKDLLNNTVFTTGILSFF